MMCTGTMLEDLFAAVERAEAKAQNVETTEMEAWFASIQESANHNSELVGVA